MSTKQQNTHAHAHAHTHTHTHTHTHVVRPKCGVQGLPFGVQQVVDLLVVDLHVGHLHLARQLRVGPGGDAVKQLVTQAWDDALLAPRAHHSVRLA